MTPYELLCDLAACLCAELTPDGAPGPDLCFCGLVPGQIVAHEYGWGCDNGKCGMAWVRLASAYPAEGVGVPAENQLGCGMLLGMDIELGVIRCLEAEADGEPPTLESMETGVAREVADMIAVRRAVMCCTSLEEVDYSLGTFSPTGPLGMVTGGTWTLSVAL